MKFLRKLDAGRSHARRWLWTLVRFSIAVTLVSAAVEALHEALPLDFLQKMTKPFHQRSRTNDEAAVSHDERPLPNLDGNPQEIAAAANLGSTLWLDVNLYPDSVGGSYSLYLSTKEPLFLQLQHEIADLDSPRVPSEILNFYLGTIDVGGDRLFPDMPRFSTVPKTDSGSLHGSFRSIQLRPDQRPNGSFVISVKPPWARLPYESLHVTFHAKDVQLYALGTQPTDQGVSNGWNSVSFTFKRGERIDVKAIALESARPVTPPPPPGRRIGEALRAFSSGYINVLQPVIYAVIRSLPLLFFLYLFRRRQLYGREAYIAVAVLFSWLFLSLGLIRGLADAFWLTRINPLKACLLFSPLFGGGIGAVAVVFVCAVWTRHARRDAAARPRFLPQHFARRFDKRRLSAGIAAIATCALALGWQYENCSPSPEWVAIVIAALIAGVAWLVLETPRTGGGFAGDLLAVLIVLALYIAFSRLVDDLPSLRVAVLWLFTIPFAYCATWMIERACRTIAGRDEPLTPGVRFAMYLAISVLVLFLVWRPANDDTLMWWTITSVAWETAELISLLLIAMLLEILHAHSAHDEWCTLEADEKAAGTVLLLTLFVFSTRNWLSVPIVLIAAWLLLKWLLVDVVEAASGNAVASVRDLVSYNDGCRALRQLKRELGKSVASGSMTFDGYRSRVEAFEAQVNELAKKLGGVNAPRVAVLASGPQSKPWDRALDGAKWGLISALPWIAVFVYNTARQTAPQYQPYWLSIIAGTVYGIAQWPLYGFFLGYFYPHIRGRNGIHKGMSLFASLAVPQLIASAITMPLNQSMWTSLTFWLLQCFAQLLIVGLIAGDLKTLQSSGLGSRHLLEVHDLGSLTAYASSLIAAVGAAISTYLAAQVTTWLTVGMQAFNLPVPKQ